MDFRRHCEQVKLDMQDVRSAAAAAQARAEQTPPHEKKRLRARAGAEWRRGELCAPTGNTPPLQGLVGPSSGPPLGPPPRLSRPRPESSRPAFLRQRFRRARAPSEEF
eukprot:2912002-Pyramimonas_sp.AAC.1